MNEPDNFLARWSRRKREQAVEAKRAKAAAPGEAAAPGPPQDEAVAQGAGPVQAGERPAAMAETPAVFDPASLPPIESIGAQTDIGAFLQPGVPESLRNAALRRAWTADPAIRDFKGLAENDWDFSDPNGVHGFGPLAPNFDVKKMAEALFHGASKEEPPIPAKAVLSDAAENAAAVEGPSAVSESPDPQDESGKNIAVQKNPESKPSSTTR